MKEEYGKQEARSQTRIERKFTFCIMDKQQFLAMRQTGLEHLWSSEPRKEQICVCVCVCDRVNKHKTIWFIHKSLPPPIFFVFSFCLSSFYFPFYIWIISCHYLQFSSVNHHTAHYIAYSTLHFTFNAPAHIQCSCSHSTLRLKLRSAYHITVCTSHSTFNLV
jgi:hypothetical protein